MALPKTPLPKLLRDAADQIHQAEEYLVDEEFVKGGGRILEAMGYLFRAMIDMRGDIHASDELSAKVETQSKQAMMEYALYQLDKLGFDFEADQDKEHDCPNCIANDICWLPQGVEYRQSLKKGERLLNKGTRKEYPTLEEDND